MPFGGGELDEDVMDVITIAGKAAGLRECLDVVGNGLLVSRYVGNGADILKEGQNRCGLIARKNTGSRHRNSPLS